MDRVVFCQSEKFIDEAVTLAKEWSLPIQIGDSDRTKDLDFDRTKVKVIQIPINSGFGPFPAVVEPLKPIVLHYYNDYIDCSLLNVYMSTEQSLMTKTHKLEVFVNDKHYISIPLFMELMGHYSISVQDDNGELSKIRFAVSTGTLDEITAYD